MCTVIDFASCRKVMLEDKQNKNTGTDCSLVKTISSSNQCTMWKIEKEKINQDHAFSNDREHSVRKYAPDPIKDIGDINRILNYFLSKKQYRNLLLFTMGINFGIRCGDLLKLKFGHILDINGNIKPEVSLIEKKNKNHRTCYMNDFVVEVAKLYVDSLTASGCKIDLNDYLFTSLSNSNSFNYYDALHSKFTSTGKPLEVKRDPSAPIQVKSVEKMLKKVINDELDIDVHAGTHLMRKTFAYQVITNAPDRNRAIEMLQRILGHKSPATTLYYAGITGEEIQAVCQNLYQGRIDFCYGIGLGKNSNYIERSDVN